MIASFKHRGLKALYEGRTARRVASYSKVVYG